MEIAHWHWLNKKRKYMDWNRQHDWKCSSSESFSNWKWYSKWKILMWIWTSNLTHIEQIENSFLKAFYIVAWTFCETVWHRLHSYDSCVHHCAICRNAILFDRYFIYTILMVWIWIISWDSFFHFTDVVEHECNSKAENENKTNNTTASMLLHM